MSTQHRASGFASPNNAVSGNAADSADAFEAPDASNAPEVQSDHRHRWKVTATQGCFFLPNPEHSPNPNLRVSEIAFEVGFQSLTHFNRVFKRIVGESPTEYRGHLPAA